MATLLESVNVAEAVLDVAEILTTACTVRTPTFTIGAAGGRSATWSEAATVCRVAQASNREALMFAERLANTIGWTVLLPYATTISSKCQITVGSSTYEVLGIKSNPSFPAWKRAVCVEVK